MQLPEIKGWEIAFDGTVQVSPDKSACSDMEVRVETSLTDLVQRVKDELSEQYDQQFAEHAWKMKLFETTYLSKGEAAYVLHVANYISLQVIEDWCIRRMGDTLDETSSLTHLQVVEKWLSQYSSIDISHSCLAELSRSSVRRNADDVVHLDKDDVDIVNMMWDSLRKQLSEVDAKKYHELLRFGTGKGHIK